ncbi:hypothetical protein AKO1_006906 [Acrasis kona]|uniref:MaoC-like domain-containing protein n=1 Tax=Acrasis kona TaxID=1008807 RepID=A0AAW2YVD3_9EUKA
MQSDDTNKIETKNISYNKRDLILYALGIGRTDKRYIYELDPSFCAFPTYPLVLNLKGDYQDVNLYADQVNINKIPGMKQIDLRKVVHGEQYYEVIQAIPTSGNFILEENVSDIWDTGRGMIIDKDAVMKDSNTGITYAKLTTSAFVIGAGGFNGKKKPQRPIPKLLNKEPDVVHEEIIPQNANLLYRLSGDYNPLHVDDSIGKNLGMKGAILHGLCTYGYSAAAVLIHFANNDSSKFKSIYGKFASPVYPGETLQTLMWKAQTEEGHAIAFETRVKERNIAVITNGLVILHTTSKL